MLLQREQFHLKRIKSIISEMGLYYCVSCLSEYPKTKIEHKCRLPIPDFSGSTVLYYTFFKWYSSVFFKKIGFLHYLLVGDGVLHYLALVSGCVSVGKLAQSEVIHFLKGLFTLFIHFIKGLFTLFIHFIKGLLT